MGTDGNLEMRVGKDVLYASTKQEGFKVYSALSRFADFLERNQNPTEDKYKDWFERTAALIPESNMSLEPNEKLNLPHRVIIDVPNKLVLYDAHEASQDMTSILRANVPDRIRRYGYQAVRFERILGRNGSSSSIKRPDYGKDTPSRGFRRPRS